MNIQDLRDYCSPEPFLKNESSGEQAPDNKITTQTLNKDWWWALNKVDESLKREGIIDDGYTLDNVDFVQPFKSGVKRKNKCKKMSLFLVIILIKTVLVLFWVYGVCDVDKASEQI